MCQHIIADYERRTAEKSKSIYDRASKLMAKRGRKTEGMKLLKNASLRYVEVTAGANFDYNSSNAPFHTRFQNAFHHLQNSDPHDALSFEMGHVVDGGFIPHIIDALVICLSKDGQDRRMLSVIDDRFAACTCQIVKLNEHVIQIL